MNCKYCKNKMEFDHSEGIGYSEAHIYACECGAEVTVHENGEENSWEPA